VTPPNISLAPERPPRKGKTLLARIIGYTILGGFIALVLAFFISFIVPSEERSYTGPAEVVKSYKQKSLCTIDVRLSDGTGYSYVIRADLEYCSSFTPGATINIKKGRVANPEGVKP
jgi:hypothetical protein